MRVNELVNKVLPAVTLLLGVTLVACGTSEPERAASPSTSGVATSSTAATDPMPSTDPSTTLPSTAHSGSVAVEGTWVSPAQDLLAANTANLGSVPMTCDGEVTMELAGGRIHHGGHVSCSMPQSPIVASGTVDSAGDYTISGDELTISKTSTNGQLFLNDQPLAPIETMLDLTATVHVDGDTMTLTFTRPQIGTVTQTWHRVG